MESNHEQLKLSINLGILLHKLFALTSYKKQKEIFLLKNVPVKKIYGICQLKWKRSYILETLLSPQIL